MRTVIMALLAAILVSACGGESNVPAAENQSPSTLITSQDETAAVDFDLIFDEFSENISTPQLAEFSSLQEPLPAAERDGEALLAAIPTLGEIQALDPEQAALEVILSGFQYWISGSTSSSTGVLLNPRESKKASRYISFNSNAGFGNGSLSGLHNSRPQSGDASQTFDPESGLVRSEGKVSLGQTGDSGSSMDFEMTLEHYACWDPGLPEQKTASISAEVKINAETAQGLESFIVSADSSLTMFTDGRVEFTTTVDYLDHVVTVHSGPNAASGNPFSGSQTRSNSDHSGQTTYAGGGSANWECPPGECREETLAKATDFLLKMLESGLELLRLTVTEEPGGDDFCLGFEVDPLEAVLAPGGEELPLQVQVTNWNEDPVDQARVSAPTAELGILLPESGETGADGKFSYTYTSDEAGTETVPISVEYSFYKQEEQALINIQDLWHFHMDYIVDASGDVTFSFDQDFSIGPGGQLVTTDRGVGIIISDWIDWECLDIDNGTSWPIQVLFDGAFSFDLGGSYAPEAGEAGSFKLTLKGDKPDFITTSNDPTCNVEDENIMALILGGFAQDPFLYLMEETVTVPAVHQAQQNFNAPEFKTSATIEIIRQAGDIP